MRVRQADVLIFAGTSEGRVLAERLSQRGISCCVSVATEYGSAQMIHSSPLIEVHTGRLQLPQMVEWLLKLRPEFVVDATHPYADKVTENIQRACVQTGTKYIRLLRGASDIQNIPGAKIFPDAKSAAEWLDTQEGTVFLTTGLKELPVFAGAIKDRGRLYARVLLQEEVFQQIEAFGMNRKQFFCMQGPFSKEMNVAMLHQTGAKFLVTKESGEAGGFQEKVDAARVAGAACVIIRRPTEENGFSMQQVEQRIFEGMQMNHPAETGHGRQQVILLGIGMGAADTMTVEGVKICESADCILGAERMLHTLKRFEKPMAVMYQSEKIAAYIRRHPEYEKIVVGLSGDVGFYSGAKKLAVRLEQDGLEVSLVCGISSVVYFASKLKTSWEDMVLVSDHGRNQNVIAAVRNHAKVFVLSAKADQIRQLAAELISFGFETVKMTVAVDLSYPSEYLTSGKPADFQNFAREGICVALLEREAAHEEVVTHGLPDTAFIRGNAPMTKEEVRSVSLSKLQLTRQAVVYDIGAGTGSVSVECARIADQGMVYAIEKKADALKLMEQNRLRLGAWNLKMIAAAAPDGLEELPPPTHVFIGGSGGNLAEIVDICLKKNPDVRIVINCITLETLTECLQILKEKNPEELDICNISTARAKTLAGYHMMMGQNPVYVITFQRKKKGGCLWDTQE